MKKEERGGGERTRDDRVFSGRKDKIGRRETEDVYHVQMETEIPCPSLIKTQRNILARNYRDKPSGRTFSLRRNVSLITFRFLFHRNAAIFLWTLNATGCNEVTFAS